MATCVLTVKTTCTQQELIKGFIEGWEKLFGSLPQKKCIAVLYAQNSVETGGNTNNMYNWNIGNVKYIPSKTSSDDDIQYMMLKNVWEIINGKKVIYQPPHKATWFRSFPTLADGIAFHLDFLKNKRYKKAWSAIEAGDPANFAHLLKVANYYTAPEEDYVKSVTYFFNKFMKDNIFEKIVTSLTPSVPTVVVERVEEIAQIIPPVIEHIEEIVQTTPTSQIESSITIAEPVIVAEPAQLSFWKLIINFLFKLFTKK